MSSLVRMLILSASAIAASSTLNAATSAPPPAVSEAPSWANEGPPPLESEWGFAPLSVTRSGVAYSPAAPAFDPAASDQSKIADLPAWASSRFATDTETETDRRPARAGVFGLFAFGGLPEPAAWGLILVGTAMICGALRGLIMANRRLDRLRHDDDAHD
jgi:hypothetical protein